jgi:hypothetical protein
MTETSVMTITEVRPPLPEDGLCVDCKKNLHKYVKKNRYLCRYCWDRDEVPSLAHLTDEQLDEHSAELQRSIEKAKVKAQLINTNSVVGFK